MGMASPRWSRWVRRLDCNLIDDSRHPPFSRIGHVISINLTSDLTSQTFPDASGTVRQVICNPFTAELMFFPAKSQRICCQSLAAAAGALLLLALLRLGSCLHSCCSGAGRDHKALAGHVGHGMALLGSRVPFWVRCDHKAGWQGLSGGEPLALGMVQTTHCWHVGRHGIATVGGVGRTGHVGTWIHDHGLRHRHHSGFCWICHGHHCRLRWVRHDAGQRSQADRKEHYKQLLEQICLVNLQTPQLFMLVYVSIIIPDPLNIRHFAKKGNRWFIDMSPLQNRLDILWFSAGSMDAPSTTRLSGRPFQEAHWHYQGCTQQKHKHAITWQIIPASSIIVVSNTAMSSVPPWLFHAALCNLLLLRPEKTNRYSTHPGVAAWQPIRRVQSTPKWQAELGRFLSQLVNPLPHPCAPPIFWLPLFDISWYIYTLTGMA